MISPIDLSHTIVVGPDLRPVSSERLDQAIQSINDMCNSYDLVGPLRQIPTSTATTSSSCSRDKISQTTRYSLESTFIAGPAFFPKKAGLCLQVTLHDPAHRNSRQFDRENGKALLPYWASLIPVFTKNVLARAKECNETIAPEAKHQVLSSSYETWAAMGFPENARISSSFPGPLGAGFAHLFIDEHKWRHAEHHFLLNLPWALCLQSVSETCVKITPLKISVPTELDPIEKMALLAKYRQDR